MKIRVTLLTENDNTLLCPKEEIELGSKLVWETILEFISSACHDGSRGIVESCELVEE